MTAIKASARSYENWLRLRIGIDFVEADLKTKHDKMRKSAFAFLRATYWRWAETILDVCPELRGAPNILAVGDTHLENFGTWRDVEGRLIWGVNDFDDAAVMPYPLDLVRLAASALVARGDDGPDAGDICAALLGGYTAGLANPKPLVLEGGNKELRKALLLPEGERAAFWEKFALSKDSKIPSRYRKVLRASMPDPQEALLAAPRTAGTGSLGRPRFVGRIEWKGGPVLREAKALVVSAWALHLDPKATGIHADTIAAGRFRAPDPHYRLADDILVRRLAPNSRKIEVKNAAGELLSPAILDLMGRDIAHCHADDAARQDAIQKDLQARGEGWLRRAANAAADAVARDYVEYR